MREKKKYILIAEIENLRIPCSLEFRSKQFIYFLYPYDVNERISILKSKILDVDNYFNIYGNDPIRNDQIILKDNSSKTIIITEIQNANNSIETNSFNEVLDYFLIILKLINLFFTDTFYIERISIFQKIDTITKLIRIVENHPESDSIASEGKELLGNFDVRYFEPFIPLILEKLLKNKQYTEVFEEYIYGKTIKKVEYRIVYLWNTLEHISDGFLEIKKKHMLIQEEKFNKLKELVKIKIDEFDQSDLVFSLSIEDAKEKIVRKMDNYPQIVDKILYMFKTQSLYTIESENIIRQMYYLRNRIFHNGIYLPQLLSKFERKYLDKIPFTLKDLEELIEKFEYLINKILLSVLELNDLFEVKENNKLMWTKQFPKDYSYFNFEFTTKNGHKIEQVAGLYHSGFKSKENLESYITKTIQYLSRKDKYLKLLNFLSKTLLYWKKFFSFNYIPSYINNLEDKLLIKFENEKKGNFIFSSKSRFMENLKSLINSGKGRKNTFLTTFLYILNYGTIKLSLQIIMLSESLRYVGETRGEFYCHELDYGCGDFKKFEHEKFESRNKCENCDNKIREIGIVNPKYFCAFFPLTVFHACNKCDHCSFQNIFIYPNFFEQLVQIPIHIVKGEEVVRKGNGFFYIRIKEDKKHLFFVTNYHILTGFLSRENFNKSEVSAKLLFHSSADFLEKLITIEIPLYTKDNLPVWIRNENHLDADLAIIPILPIIYRNCKVFALSKNKTEIPPDLNDNLLFTVIGFKNGKFNDGIPQMMAFPTSKKEFLKIFQRTSISIPPSNGMDGSPAFLIFNNYKDKKFRPIFIGIYTNFQNSMILKSDLIIEQIDKIDIAKYVAEIFSNLIYSYKRHLK